jgi:uncharacterized protein
MTQAVFADSFYYLALVNPDDNSHGAAVELSRTLARKVVTTSWVLTEVADGMAAPYLRMGFSQLYEVMRRDADVLIVPATESLFQSGVALYSSRQDKDWSLTDCISFRVMKAHHLTEALTHDHHFKQAGFACLL